VRERISRAASSSAAKTPRSCSPIATWTARRSHPQLGHAQLGAGLRSVERVYVVDAGPDAFVETLARAAFAVEGAASSTIEIVDRSAVEPDATRIGRRARARRRRARRRREVRGKRSGTACGSSDDHRSMHDAMKDGRRRDVRAVIAILA